ncbi:MAG: peptidase S41, partial [bacterium]|nr:peptidase S41 [bacterium]
LPLKQAMHAVSPVQRLKLLKYHNAGLDKRTFHDRMLSIFTGLRDLHTNYILPNPWRRMVVFLPFLIEDFYEGEGESKERKYMVSKIAESFTPSAPSFKVGATITHWNGIPIARAVAVNANRNAGSNTHARQARGVERMTIRPLKMSLLPDEEWVEITYLDGKLPCKAIFEWRITPPPKEPIGS